MMNQIKIIIAEDEPAILRGICSTISTISQDFFIAATAYDGENALSLIRAHQPQIVITDIKMPLMDGLTMISKAKEENLSVKFVILTGFAEFEYAKKAISLGISDYLLKPIDPDEMKKLLIRIRQDILHDTAQSQSSYIRSCFFKHPVNHLSYNPLAHCNLCLLFSYYGSVVNNSYSEFTLSGEIVRNLDTDFLNGIMEQYDLTIYSFRGNYHNEYVYAMVYPESKEIDILSVAKAIKKNTEKADTYVNFVLSSILQAGTKIENLIQHTYLFTLFHLPFGKNSLLIQRDEITSNNKIAVSGSIEILTNKFRAGISAKELKSILSEMTSYWERINVSQFQLLSDIRHIAGSLIQLSPNTGNLLFDPSEIIAASDSYADLYDSLLSELTKVLSPEYIHQKKSSLQLVNEVKKYLDKNFTQQITYKVFYDIWGYNEKYITTLFKEAFGISPSKYITSLRLELAKNIMVENPQILLKDVAEQTGYLDALYFSRVFKNSEGMSPSAFLHKNKPPLLCLYYTKAKET